MRTYVRRRGRVALTLCAVTALSACGETGAVDFSFGSRNASAEGPAQIGATPLAERDVEAPEIFAATDEGLWDGRPSLGGVWVAHPDVADPERVIIRNEENGRYVIGALFRRERENPGPVIQVSSDAAEALEILAGAPTALQVVALRREEAPPPPEAAAEDEAVAEAAVAEDSDLPPVVAASLPAGEEIAPETELAADLAADPEAAPAEAPAPRRGFLARLFQPAAAATPRAEAPATGLSAEEVAAGITTAAFTTDTLDPVTSAAEAAIARSEATEVASLAPAAAPPAPSLERPFVQIGLFSAQENADTAGQALRNAGLVPTIHEQTSNGRRFWRVVVGPAPTAEDRAAVLETVRGLGFGDAYFVTR